MKLAIIPISEIECTDRFREELGNIEELVLSIKKEGLIEPLAVCLQPSSENHKYRLLAGGRRFTAATKAALTEVPVRVFDEDLTEEQMLSIELMENVCRKDLEWYEKVKLESRIHDLQVAIHGQKVSGPSSGGWGRQDTATLLNVSNAKITQDLQLAKAIEAVPELKDKCKTADEARRVLGSMFKTFQTAENAKAIRERQEKTPLDIQREELVNRYILNDCIEGLKSLPSGEFHLVEIDPPYAIDLNNQKRSEGNLQLQMEGYNEIPSATYLPFMDRLLGECYRVMSPDSWLILWFGPDPWFDPLFQLVRKNNFETRRIPAEWVKQDHTGQTAQPRIYLPGCTEWFYYCRKGNAQIQKPGRKNIFEYKPVPAARKSHPTERPIELIQDILETFGQIGQRVLVPFLGSGNTLLAAENLGMKGIGYDLTKEYKDSFTIKVFEGRPGQYVSYK